MKKFTRLFLIIVILFVILGLILPLLKIDAAENPDPKTDSLKGVMNNINELNNLKDNNNLSAEEKDAKELELRKDALSKILDLTLMEIDSFKNNLESLQLEKGKQTDTKNQLLDLLNTDKQYSENLKETLQNELSLDDTKNLTQEFKDWKDANYNFDIQKITSFTLVFQEKYVLKIADTRLNKINSDLKKLEGMKLISKEDNRKSLDSATKSLTNAHNLYSSAENLLMNALKNEFNASSTLLNDSLATTTIKDANEASSTIKTTSTGTTTPQFEKRDDIKLLIEKSFNEVKNAYKYFLDISNKVRKKLGLQ
ncbi:MAG: Uncharacterized protein Athens071426_359 [Parcubacteria group bacterium Athens0714_26]|nr:MAG: Uncharacterized protein Athens101426_143 [Parcubacteria group bacterium Athens1014_26]TSD02939.1 MAG: Uncharacterized protein Athens071426_359 [Parcubacteria group bacterium Athens0714_26]